jgi:hypothetical protein
MKERLLDVVIRRRDGGTDNGQDAKEDKSRQQKFGSTSAGGRLGEAPRRILS